MHDNEHCNAAVYSIQGLWWYDNSLYFIDHGVGHFYYQLIGDKAYVLISNYRLTGGELIENSQLELYVYDIPKGEPEQLTEEPYEPTIAWDFIVTEKGIFTVTCRGEGDHCKVLKYNEEQGHFEQYSEMPAQQIVFFGNQVVVDLNHGRSGRGGGLPPDAADGDPDCTGEGAPDIDGG